jgi:hypothetical protein
MSQEPVVFFLRVVFYPETEAAGCSEILVAMCRHHISEDNT